MVSEERVGLLTSPAKATDRDPLPPDPVTGGARLETAPAAFLTGGETHPRTNGLPVARHADKLLQVEPATGRSPGFTPLGRVEVGA